MAGVKGSRIYAIDEKLFPLLGKERARVRLQPMPKAIEFNLSGVLRTGTFR
jgi:hypothetical protein